MIIERKTAAIILAVTIGLSLFVGLAFAARPVAPQPITILGLYATNYLGLSVTSTGTIYNTNITADKPVKFTVSVDVWDFAAGQLTLLAMNSPTGNTVIGIENLVSIDGDYQHFTETFGGYGMYLSAVSGWFTVRWLVLVEGSADTVITVS